VKGILTRYALRVTIITYHALRFNEEVTFLFGVNLDLIDLIEREFKDREDFFKNLSDGDVRQDLACRMADRQIDSISDMLPDKWKKLCRSMLVKVMDFILVHYLEKKEKLSLTDGLLLFHQSSEWIEHAKEFLLTCDVIGERGHILLDCLDAHREGSYNLSVPVLHIQLLGLLSEVSFKPKIMKMESGIIPGTGQNIKITGLCINIPAKGKMKFLDDTASEILQGIDKFVVSKRGNILSGSEIFYGTVANSTEMVMFLHILLLALGME